MLVLSQSWRTAWIIVASDAWNVRLWKLITLALVDLSISWIRALYACSSRLSGIGCGRCSCSRLYSRSSVEMGSFHCRAVVGFGKRREYELSNAVMMSALQVRVTIWPVFVRAWIAMSGAAQ